MEEEEAPHLRQPHRHMDGVDCSTEAILEEMEDGVPHQPAREVSEDASTSPIDTARPTLTRRLRHHLRRRLGTRTLEDRRSDRIDRRIREIRHCASSQWRNPCTPHQPTLLLRGGRRENGATANVTSPDGSTTDAATETLGTIEGEDDDAHHPLPHPPQCPLIRKTMHRLNGGAATTYLRHGMWTLRSRHRTEAGWHHLLV